MKTVRQLVAISLAVLVLVSIPYRAKGNTGGTSINVTTIVHDYDSTGTELLLLRSDDYNGTNQASYSAALDPNLSSTIYNGVWFLRMYSQSVRTLWITPNDPYGLQPAAPPAGYYWQVCGGWQPVL